MMDRLKNNLGLKIIAAVFAVFLWWMVVNIDDPIDTKQFNVEVAVTNPEVITNAGKSYQIEDDIKNVTVTVKARRKVLGEIKKSHISATADLREMQDSSVPIRVSIDGFEDSCEEVSAYPRNIQVSVENTQKKTFPITTIATGNPRDGYFVGEMTASPQTVDISGPESAISKIDKVVAKVDVSEMSVDTKVDVNLVYYDAADNIIDKTLLSSNCDKNGVSVSVDIWPTKKVTLEFDTTEIKMADGFVLTGIETEPQTVRVAGEKDTLNALAKLQIPAEALKKTNVSSNEEVIVDIASYLPEGVVLADSNGNNVVVRFLVEQAGTKKVLLPVGSVQILNASDKFDLEKGSAQEIELQFSGATEVIKDLDSEDFEVYIDLKDYKEEGTYVVEVEVKGLPANCTYIGNATVEITLTEK